MDSIISKGHMGYSTHDGYANFEWFERDGEVYRAPSDAPLDICGYRMGARWECSVNHFREWIDVQPKITTPYCNPEYVSPLALEFGFIPNQS